MAEVKKLPHYQIVNGIRIPAAFSPKCVKEAFEYKPRADDLIISTYPKCGTTWMQNIVTHIFRKGQPLKPRDFLTASPFIEMFGEDGVARMPRPGAIKTHLPYSLMPYSPEAKYIFVIRNVRDTCVSLYKHTTLHPGIGYMDGKFDDFFELFMTGQVEYNDYFDHLLSWYPHRNDPNVFYTTYEDMKKDTKAVIVKLAEFIGKEYEEMVKKDSSVLNNILRFTSFQYMKDNFSDIYDFLKFREELSSPDTPEGLKHLLEYTLSLNPPEKRPPMDFIRKGIVGDWKNYFSDEQTQRLDERFETRTAGTDIANLWSGTI